MFEAATESRKDLHDAMSDTPLTKEQEAKEKALAAALAGLESEFGKGTIIQMDGDALPDIQSFPSGSLALDVALGVGGIPEGRIVEIYGQESSGKTTLCYHWMAEVQKRGGKAVFIDAEHAMDPRYSAAIGVNMDELMVSQPDSGEQALEIADRLTASGAVDLIVVDSVAALTPQAELDGGMSDQVIGLQARMMSKAMRKLAGNCKRTNTTIVFTNQIREKVGVMFGSPETTPGGKALKFYASVRMKIARIQQLKGKIADPMGGDKLVDGTMGNRTQVKILKNKVAPPFRQAEFDIMFGTGISWEGEIIDYGLKQGIITKSGSFFSYGEDRIGQGRENVRAYLNDNPEVAEELKAKIRAGLGFDEVGEIDPSADEDAILAAEADAVAEAAELAAAD